MIFKNFGANIILRRNRSGEIGVEFVENEVKNGLKVPGVGKGNEVRKEKKKGARISVEEEVVREQGEIKWKCEDGGEKKNEKGMGM